MTMALNKKRCVPCEGAAAPLSAEETKRYLVETPGWAATANKKISKEFDFKNFKESMAFINKVAGVAEVEGHHPDIYVFYNKVRLELHTHVIGGLSKNDFILAAKIDAV